MTESEELRWAEGFGETSNCTVCFEWIRSPGGVRVWRVWAGLSREFVRPALVDALAALRVSLEAGEHL